MSHLSFLDALASYFAIMIGLKMMIYATKRTQEDADTESTHEQELAEFDAQLRMNKERE